MNLGANSTIGQQPKLQRKLRSRHLAGICTGTCHAASDAGRREREREKKKKERERERASPSTGSKTHDLKKPCLELHHPSQQEASSRLRACGHRACLDKAARVALKATTSGNAPRLDMLSSAEFLNPNWVLLVDPASTHLLRRSRHRAHCWPCASALMDALMLIPQLSRDSPAQTFSSNCIDTVQEELFPHALMAAEATKSFTSKVSLSMRLRSCKARCHCRPRSQAVRAVQKVT